MLKDELRDLEALKSDIASRLRSACAHFSEGEFADLVEQIAQVELKYARRALMMNEDPKAP
jgi:hypothetical protein